MTINIISRHETLPVGLIIHSWEFYISASDAQIVMANYNDLKFGTPLGDKFVNSEMYDPTLYGLDPYSQSVWGVYQDVNGWFIALLILPDNPFFVSVTDINDITGATLPGFTSFIVNPYNNGLAFTLDPLYFTCQTASLDTYFQINTTIEAFNFFSNTSIVEQKQDKIIPFKGNIEWNVGQLVHRLMDNFNSVNSNFFQYLPAKVTIEVKEIAYLNNTLIRIDYVVDQLFVAGLKKNITNNLGFLAFNNNPSKASTIAKAKLNMLLPINTDLELTILQNNTPVSTTSLAVNEITIAHLPIDFSTFNQGDTIDCVISSQGVPITPLNPTKKFLILPPNRYSNLIVWEDIFLVQDSLEFTGSINLKTEFESQTQKKYKNFVEILEILSVKGQIKLTINTGWILKTDINTIESLMTSKRAWMSYGVDYISLRPLSKSMLNFDSDRELIEYTIEFQINKTYNEETYSL